MQLLPHAPALSGTPGRRRAALIAVWLVALISILLGMVARPVAASASGLAPAGVPAAACTTKPTIVMVHGVWADAYSWRGEIDRLQPDGYVVRAIANPLRGLTSDAADVADFLKTIRGPIVLVGHSYGGSVITNAATGHRWSQRATAPLSAGQEAALKRAQNLVDAFLALHGPQAA